jgi:hypothetical protein
VRLTEPPFEAARTHRAADAAWLATAVAHGAPAWLDNAAGAIHAVNLDGYAHPLHLTEDSATSTYVASPISAWVRYPAFEARRQLPPISRAAAGLVAAPVAGLLQFIGLRRAAVLGNWLMSTNLYPRAGAAAWRQAREAALVIAPDRPLALRSVCAGVDADLPSLLAADGWLLVPARLAYLCDPSDAQMWKHNHVRKDRRLLDEPGFGVSGPDSITAAELPVLRRLFREVFITKHSPLNPDFSDAFFALCREQRFLDVYTLRHDDETVGVLAILERHGWVTTPLIGYDTAKPQALALYRRLMALLLAESARRQARLHYSSGAGGFKRARGGEAMLEYTALYVRHLPRHQQVAAHAFNALATRLAAPLLARFG